MVDLETYMKFQSFPLSSELLLHEIFMFWKMFEISWILGYSLTLVENPVRDADANAIIDGFSGVAPWRTSIMDVNWSSNPGIDSYGILCRIWKKMVL